MPDGNFEQYQVERTSAYRQMDGRLIHYGKVLLQQAKGDEPDARDERTPIPRVVWTAAEETRAWQVQRLVILLPPTARFIIQAFYKAREADYWHELSPLQQGGVEASMCREVNARVREFCRLHGGTPLLVLRQTYFRELRIGAVKDLCAKDGHPVAFAQQDAPTGYPVA